MDKHIKKAFTRLGRSLGLYTCTHGLPPSESDWGEWLYDLTWIRYGRSVESFNPNDFHEIMLALESEWGNIGHVRDDYQKLVQAKARFKVMIWQREDGLENDAKVKYMEKLARNDPKNLGESYLFDCYNGSVGEFDFREVYF